MNEEGLDQGERSREPMERPGTEEGKAGSLEQVRDILFGSRAKGSEEQISEIARSLRDDAASFRDEAVKLFVTLESRIQEQARASRRPPLSGHETPAELEAIAATSLVDLSEDIRESIEAIDRRLEELVEDATRRHEELRTEIIEQNGALQDTLRRIEAELNSHWSLMRRMVVTSMGLYAECEQSEPAPEGDGPSSTVPDDETPENPIGIPPEESATESNG